MMRLAAVLLSLTLMSLAACALPPRTTTLARGYEQPSTGSLIGGGDAGETIGKNPEPSFTQPSNGIGAPGYIAPGSSR